MSLIIEDCQQSGEIELPTLKLFDPAPLVEKELKKVQKLQKSALAQKQGHLARETAQKSELDALNKEHEKLRIEKEIYSNLARQEEQIIKRRMYDLRAEIEAQKQVRRELQQRFVDVRGLIN